MEAASDRAVRDPAVRDPVVRERVVPVRVALDRVALWAAVRGRAVPMPLVALEDWPERAGLAVAPVALAALVVEVVARAVRAA